MTNQLPKDAADARRCGGRCFLALPHWSRRARSLQVRLKESRAAHVGRKEFPAKWSWGAGNSAQVNRQAMHQVLVVLWHFTNPEEDIPLPQKLIFLAKLS